MSNPIIVHISVTQPNTTLYIAVDTYAWHKQRAQITPLTPQPGQPFIASGNGEGARLKVFTYPTRSVGIYEFSVLIQYDNGSGVFQNSAGIWQATSSMHTLHQTVVFSEDSTDNDDNDCLVTFMWFERNVDR